MRNEKIGCGEEGLRVLDGMEEGGIRYTYICLCGFSN